MPYREIDKWRGLAMRGDTVEAKVFCAADGNFFLFSTVDKKRVWCELRDAGLDEARISFDFEGTKTLVQ